MSWLVWHVRNMHTRSIVLFRSSLCLSDASLSAEILRPLPAGLSLQELNGKPMAIGETEHWEFRSLHPGPRPGPGAVCDLPPIVHVTELQFMPTAL